MISIFGMIVVLDADPPAVEPCNDFTLFCSIVDGTVNETVLVGKLCIVLIVLIVFVEICPSGIFVCFCLSGLLFVFKIDVIGVLFDVGILVNIGTNPMDLDGLGLTFRICGSWSVTYIFFLLFYVLENYSWVLNVNYIFLIVLVFSRLHSSGNALDGLVSGRAVLEFHKNYDSCAGRPLVCVLRLWKVERYFDGPKNVRIVNRGLISKVLPCPYVPEAADFHSM